jgi:hypothetical protein
MFVRRPLAATLIVVVGIACVSMAAAPQEDQQVSAAVQIRGVDVKLQVSKDNEIVFIAGDHEQQARIEVPKRAGRIIEVRACAWMETGVALAIKAQAEEGRYGYFWATMEYAEERGAAADMQFIDPSVGQILAGEEDFDLAGIVNSGGDSVYIILARHTRQLNDEVSGYAYIHNCPRASLIEGTLLKLTAK